jgi:hypothetical protein
MATLTQRVQKWSQSNDKHGVDGLVLMSDLVQHMGKEHDWDASAQFIQATDRRDQVANSTFRLILRAYFGSLVTLARDAKHPTGYRFKFGIQGKWPTENGVPQPVRPGNHWGVVEAAIKNGEGFRSSTFLKNLRAEIRGEDEPMTEDEETKAFLAKLDRRAIADAKLVFTEGYPVDAYVGKVQAEYKKLQKQQAAEQAQIGGTGGITQPQNGGAEVIEDMAERKAG